MGCGAVLFGADLGRSQAHVMVLASLSVLVSALLFTRAYRLSGVRAELAAPFRVTVGEELCVCVQLQNAGPRAHHQIRVEPPRLASDARSTAPEREIDELLPGEQQSARFGLRFATRGPRELEPFRAAALLPLGFSRGAAVLTRRARVMVVPKVARVVEVVALERARQSCAGVVRGSTLGDTSELLGVRPYRVGDPLRDLHARSWARHGSPMIRQYEAQRSNRVAVVVDTDAGAATPGHAEAALSLGAGIVARLSGTDSQVDLLIAGTQLASLSGRRGAAALHEALDALAAVQHEVGFAAPRMLAALGPRLPLLASVVFVALTWDEAREGFVAALEARGGRCLVYVVAAEGSRSARLTRVPLAAITEGRELLL